MPQSPDLTVSLIVPVLNEAAIACQNLKALWRLKQKFPERICELIVVDGGSTDNTQTIALNYADLLIESGCGRALQMNVGAFRAVGDILMFVHIDTSISEESLSHFFKCIDGEDTKSIWGFFSTRISNDNDKAIFWIIGRMMSLRSRMTRVATGDQCLFIGRELFTQLGGYAPIPLMEDVEICKRLRQITSPLVIDIPVTASSRRWQQRGVWRTIHLMCLLRFDYWRGINPEDLAQRYYPGFQSEKYAVALLAKLPVPGKVKTRLIPVVGDHVAADLHRQMLTKSLTTLSSLPKTINCQLWLAEERSLPGVQEESLQIGDVYLCESIACHKNISLHRQTNGDLGARMLAIASSALVDHAGVVLIGADCPAIDQNYINEAIECLRRGVDVVLGPAVDGGYVLIAMRVLYPSVFKEIDWGSDKVLGQTLDKLRALGVRSEQLATLPDIDRPEDLALLAKYGIDY